MNEIKLFLLKLRSFSETFTEKAFKGIPVEELDNAWTSFYDKIKQLREKYPETEE